MLPVQFGTPDYFCVDYVHFIIIDFKGTYMPSSGDQP
jgi:hypothetical protein